MSSFALKVLEELISYYPALVPCVILFYLESAAHLQLWKAVQRVPLRETYHDGDKEAAEIKSDSSKNPRRSKLLASGGTILFILYFNIIMAISRRFQDASQAKQIKTFYLYTMLLPAILQVYRMILVLCGKHTYNITRNEKGEISVTLSTVGNLGRRQGIFFVLLGPVVGVAAFWFEQPAAMLIVFMSFLHLFANPSQRNDCVRFRRWALFAAFFVACDAALIKHYVDHDYEATIIYGYGLHAHGQGTAIQWHSVLANAAYLFFPFYTLCILLRFDYANSLAADHVVPVRRGTIGFRMTHSRLESFARPYFTMAFIIVLGAFVGVAALCVSGYLKCTFENVGFFVMLIALPVMVATALAQAAMKGELKKLWSYEEDWGAIPTVNQEACVDDNLLEGKSDDSVKETFESEGLVLLMDEKNFAGEQAV